MEEEFDFSDIVKQEEFDFTDVVSAPIDPRVAQAGAVARAGKDYANTLKAEQARFNSELGTWEKARIAELQPLVKTYADVQKYQQLFEKERQQKILQLQAPANEAVKSKFEAWKTLSSQPPLPDPNAPATPLTDAARSAYSFVTNQLPKALLLNQLQAAPRRFEEIFTLPAGQVNPISNIDEFKEWALSDGKFDEPVAARAKRFFDSLSPQQQARIRTKVEDQIKASRRQTLSEVETQEQEAADVMVGAVQSLEDVNSIRDFASLVGSTGGQVAAQIPLSRLTKGAASFLLERAAIYENQLDQLAAENGLTRQEVIDQGLDDTSGVIGALAAAGLDFIGANAVLNAVRGGALRRSFSGVVEAATETSQGAIEEVSATAGEQVKQSPGQAFAEAVTTKEGLMRRGTEAIGGLFGGVALSGTGRARQAANDLAQQIDPRLVQLQDQMVADITNAQTIRSDAGQVPQTGVTPQTSQDQGGQDLQQPPQTPGNAQDQVKPRYTVRGELVTDTPYEPGQTFEGAPDVGRDFNKDTNALYSTDESEYVLKAREILQQGLATGQITQEQGRELEGQLAKLETKFNRSTARVTTDMLRKAMRFPVNVKTTDIRQALDALKGYISGFRAGTKDANTTKAEIRAEVKALAEKVDIPANKTKSLLTKVLNLNFGSTLQIERLKNFIEKMADGIAVDQQYQRATELRDTIRTNIKRIPASQRPYAIELVNTNPNDIDNIEAYLGAAENINDYLSNPEAALNDANNRQLIGTVVSEAKNNRIQELIELGVSPEGLEGLTLQQLDDIEAGIDERVDDFNQNRLDAKYQERRDRLVTAIEYAQLGLPNDAYGKLLQAIELNRLEKLSDLQKVLRATNNYAQNKVKDGWAEALSKAQQAMNEAQGLDARFDEGNQSSLKIGGALQSKILYFTGGMKDVMAKIMALSGMDSVINGYARAKAETDTLIKEADDKLKSLGLKPKTMWELATNKKARKAATESLLRQALLNRVGAWYPGEDPQQQYREVLNSIEVSNQRTQAATVDQYMKEQSAYVTELANKYASETREEFLEKFKKDFPKDYEFWEWRKAKMAEITGQLKESTEVWHDTIFKSMDGYAGKIGVRTLSGEQIPPLVAPVYNDKAPTKVNMASTAIDRTSKLNQDQIYSYDGLAEFFNSYKESLTDIYTTPARIQSRMFFSDPRVSNIFGQNLEFVKQSFFGLDRALATGNVDNESLRSRNIRQKSKAWKFFNLTARAFKTAIYSGPWRYLLQTIPTYGDLMVQLGDDFPLMFEAMEKVSALQGKEAEIFNKVPLGLRGSMVGGYAIGDKEFSAARSGLSITEDALDDYQNMFDWANQRLTFGQALGDIKSAKIVWVANYLKALKDAGVDPKTVDLSQEHKQERNEAIAYANGMTNRIAGPSQMEEMPSLFRGRDVNSQLIRNIVFFAGGFAVQQKARIGDAIFTLAYGGNKDQAVKDISGVVASTMLFALIAEVLAAGAEEGAMALLSAMGIPADEPERKEEEFWKNVGQRGTYDALPFTMIAGSVSDEAFKELFNWFLYWNSGKEESYIKWRSEGGGLPGSPPPRDGLELGLKLAGPYAASITKLYQSIREFTAIDNNTIRLNGKEHYITDEQANMLYLLAAMDFASSIGIDLAEIARLRREMRKAIKENIKKQNKATPSPFTPQIELPVLEPQFQLPL